MKITGIKIKKDKKELSNAGQYPKFYYARHMYSGLCGYEDKTILVDTACMKSMAKSFNGKPVYVLHDERSIEERMKNIHDADGFVTETFYNEVDGWLWSKIMVVSDAGHAHVAKGWSVSNAYIPNQWGKGGTKHNCEYDEELLSAEFTHLAIVPNPRYEDACIFTPDEFKIYQEKEREQLNELQNSKTKKGYKMKIFKKKKVEVTEIDSDVQVEYKNANGDIVETSLQEMVNALEAHDKKEVVNSKHKIKVNGKMITIAEAAKKYAEIVNMEDEHENDDEHENEDDESCNEDDENCNEDEHENEDGEYDNEDDEAMNEDDETANEDKVEKKNSKKNHFKELKNANRKKQSVHVMDTPQNKLQRGKDRYGSA